MFYTNTVAPSHKPPAFVAAPAILLVDVHYYRTGPDPITLPAGTRVLLDIMTRHVHLDSAVVKVKTSQYALVH